MGILETLNWRARSTIDMVRALARGSERLGNLTVHGQPPFRRAVQRALILLRDEGLPAWTTLALHVHSIFESRKSFIVVDSHPSFMFVLRDAASQPPILLAAAIAQMAFRCQLHRDHQATQPGRPVPREIHAGPAALELCDRAYRECVDALTHKATQEQEREDSES